MLREGGLPLRGFDVASTMRGSWLTHALDCASLTEIGRHEVALDVFAVDLIDTLLLLPVLPRTLSMLCAAYRPVFSARRLGQSCNCCFQFCFIADRNQAWLAI